MKNKILDFLGFIVRLLSIIIPIMVVALGIVEVVSFASRAYKIFAVCAFIVECLVVALSVAIED